MYITEEMFNILGLYKHSHSCFSLSHTHTCTLSHTLMFCQAFYLRLLCFLIFHATLLMSVPYGSVGALRIDRKVHIVYMGDLTVNHRIHHRVLLDQELGSGASELLVRSYTKSFNGFAANLSDEEAKKIANRDEVVSVFPSKQRELHTTRSWSFIGFPINASKLAFESHVIIGMLDTGIWPESDSFSDEGFDPPPSKWKGTCHSSNFTCNRKIIGAKYYLSERNVSKGEIASPRDSNGHGSHTSSIAAGRQVRGASLYGLAKGIARGGVPSARIAVYKICWSDGCSDADILAAFDDAIHDGVDIISISAGGPFRSDYFDDSIAIGSFHAMKNGILTSNSGGNTGPSSSTVQNYSPWSLTVAASTIDRQFVAEVKLRNGNSYNGTTVNTFDLKDTMHPLVYAGDAPNTSAGYDGSSSRHCYYGSLDEKIVKGKIVLCDSRTEGGGLILAGAIGAVMQADSYTDYALSYPLPATVIGPLDRGNILQYINMTSVPGANILKSQGLDDTRAPFIVSFSSRGPNPITADILKPDLCAPGVDILAAWSPIGSMSVYPDDKRSVSYNLLSGTSMACPHATGAAAYVKSFHPTWSPAAIKSALMTSAYPMEATKNPEAQLAYGAGQVNPIAAINPGLVYDTSEADYVRFLCGQGYSSKDLRLVTGDNGTCSVTNNGTVWDLNYPSFALSVKSGKAFSAIFKRTVTNVGHKSSTYTAVVSTQSGIKITVEPSILHFKFSTEKKSFEVRIQGAIAKFLSSGSIAWSDGENYVRSPVVVYTSS
ncbi:uncharacterized protein A4U43_C02F730 [Asparagus officinalis]|uniref:Subtilisin-like protease fibronectin type-III domain-containing protein n=1 Tax=Asparagus officinalis TaxID=4686 RepID=A0A5P1FFI6_ASPOF|nr:cucumisin-like [Asparagus officinalis]ONK76872.1 uncharacterized protein A4U43_C02F730 [Asparagus officinalis]